MLWRSRGLSPPGRFRRPLPALLRRRRHLPAPAAGAASASPSSNRRKSCTRRSEPAARSLRFLLIHMRSLARLGSRLCSGASCLRGDGRTLPREQPRIRRAARRRPGRRRARRAARSVWQSRRSTLFFWHAAALAVGAALDLGCEDRAADDDTSRIFIDTLSGPGSPRSHRRLLLDTLIARQPYLHFTVTLVSVALAFGVLFMGYLGYARRLFALGHRDRP